MTADDTLAVEELTFRVRRSTRRHTIGITVYPDGRLVVAAPCDCPLTTIDDSLRRKLPWVRRKRAELAARPSPAPRHWVEGERLPYLGASFPLAIVAGAAAPVRLSGGRFLMDRAAIPDAPRHMQDWYLRHADVYLRARVVTLAPMLHVSPTLVQVSDLGRRWGTCDSRGRVRFHWQVVLFPRPVIGYIVVHELAHLHELDHSSRFWRHVEAIVPDHRRHRLWLREQAAAYAL